MSRKSSTKSSAALFAKALFDEFSVIVCACISGVDLAAKMNNNRSMDDEKSFSRGFSVCRDILWG